MIAFGSILDHFATLAAQTVQMVAFGTILVHFATRAAQTVQIVAFGTILNHFATGPLRRFKWSLWVPFWTISPPGLALGASRFLSNFAVPSVSACFLSEWLSFSIGFLS
jgi:hypothetical protein